jgi:hypothetical protein
MKKINKKSKNLELLSTKQKLRENLVSQLSLLHEIEHSLKGIFSLKTTKDGVNNNEQWWIEYFNAIASSTREVGLWGGIKNKIISHVMTESKVDAIEKIPELFSESTLTLRLNIGRRQNAISNSRAILKTSGSNYNYLCVIFEPESYTSTSSKLLECLTKKGVATFILPFSDYSKVVKSIKETDFHINAVLSRTNADVQNDEYGYLEDINKMFRLSDSLPYRYMTLIISRKFTGDVFISTEIDTEQMDFSFTGEWLEEYFEYSMENPGVHQLYNNPDFFEHYSLLTNSYADLDLNIDDIRLYYLKGEFDLVLNWHTSGSYENIDSADFHRSDFDRLKDKIRNQQIALSSVSKQIAFGQVEVIALLNGYSIDNNTIQFSDDELKKVKKLVVDLDVNLTTKNRLEFSDNISKMVEIETTATYFNYDEILSQIDNLLIIECTRKESGEVILTNFYKASDWRPQFFSKTNRGLNVVCLEIDTSKIHLDFLIEYLSNDLGRSSTRLSAYESKGVFRTAVENIKINLPEIHDQLFISEALSKAGVISQRLNQIKSTLLANTKKSKEINVIFDEWTEKLDLLDKPEYFKRLISKGETDLVEFKETLNLDIKTQKKEKYIELSSLKTIVGFLNSKGGTLFIGVSDKSKLTGIEKEVEKLYKNSKDKFKLHFKNILKDNIGESFYPFIHHEVIFLMDHLVFVVECKQSPQPCYLKGKDFYVRVNPATDKLEGPELVNYIQNHQGFIR